MGGRGAVPQHGLQGLNHRLTPWPTSARAPYDWKMETWKKQQPLQLQVVGGSDESPLQKRARGAADLWKREAVLCVPQNLGKYAPGELGRGESARRDPIC